MIEICTTAPHQTQAAGEALAAHLRQGAIVGFTGDLGAGKTCFIKGLCRGLRAAEEVTSPTFVLMHCYAGRLPVYHFDLYRLDSPQQLYDIDYEAYFWGDGITLVEWVERAEPLLAREELVRVAISFGDGECERRISIEGLPGEHDYAREFAERCTSLE